MHITPIHSAVPITNTTSSENLNRKPEDINRVDFDSNTQSSAALSSIPQPLAIPHYPRPDFYSTEKNQLHGGMFKKASNQHNLGLFRDRIDRLTTLLQASPRTKRVIISVPPKEDDLDLFLRSHEIRSCNFSAKHLVNLNLKKPNRIEHLEIYDAQNIKELHLEGCQYLRSLLIKNSKQLHKIYFHEEVKQRLSSLQITHATQLEPIHFSSYTHLHQLILGQYQHTELHLEGCSFLDTISIKQSRQLRHIFFPKANPQSLSYLNLRSIPRLAEPLNLSRCTNLRYLSIEQYAHEYIYLAGCSVLASLQIKHSRNLRRIHLHSQTKKTLSRIHLNHTPRLEPLKLAKYSNLRELTIGQHLHPELHLEGCHALSSLHVRHSPLLECIYFSEAAKKNLTHLVINYSPQLKTLDLSGYTQLKKIFLDRYDHSELNLKECFMLNTLKIRNSQKLHTIHFTEEAKKTLRSLHLYHALQTDSFDFANYPQLEHIFIGMYPYPELNLKNCLSLRRLIIKKAPALQQICFPAQARHTLSVLRIEHAPQFKAPDMTEYTHLKRLSIHTHK